MAPDEIDRDVLSSLPRTRPQRRSAKRDRPVKAPPKAAGPKSKGKSAKPVGASGKDRRDAPRPAPRAAPKAGGGRRRVPQAGFAPPRERAGQGAPSGAALIGTAVQAAGELAQIGLTVGGHALRSALGRLSKP